MLPRDMLNSGVCVYIYICNHEKQCALSVITTMALWQLMHLRLPSVRFEHSVCRGSLMTTLYIYMYIYIYIYIYTYIVIYNELKILVLPIGFQFSNNYS